MPKVPQSFFTTGPEPVEVPVTSVSPSRIHLRVGDRDVLIHREAWVERGRVVPVQDDVRVPPLAATREEAVRLEAVRGDAALARAETRVEELKAERDRVTRALKKAKRERKRLRKAARASG